MKNKWKMWSGFAAVIFILASCASSTHIEKDDSVNFTDYKTFAWLEKNPTGEKDKNKPGDLTEQRIREAVNKELAKSAGWKEVKSRPDVFLSYDVLVERGSSTSTSPVYSRPFSRVFYNRSTGRYFTVFYPSQFEGYERDERSIREGTVTISMIDGKTDKTVWQGWTTDEVNSRNLTSREIQNSVKSIFKKFDIAKN
ncbi:MAG: DUF4136 domain-containing protein [Chitinophagaceae bacterium]|nr:DUF4136 domain-containing protein [Chitinophagaceae bacterium]MBP6478776.1 DUF4136 domain-containing protein [Chitinophagaceae bacterium]MBP7109050.1 DUF4136 domain-containing protein [Chitinophagaceae bacterium]MBP7315696.1 DUF4136 domain-containing protein [Chitinophagaceae bacterium]HRA12924.1 DUF4136 domain-containing protein [Chitinophagaceae bacterium]